MQLDRFGEEDAEIIRLAAVVKEFHFPFRKYESFPLKISCRFHFVVQIGLDPERSYSSTFQMG